MRLFFIALLIALLPLRNGVGDAMALGTQPKAVVAAGTHCADHAQAMEAAALEAAAMDHGQSCTDCQICHGVALPTTTLIAALGYIDHPAPTRVGVTFASATPALGIKPPIS